MPNNRFRAFGRGLVYWCARKSGRSLAVAIFVALVLSFVQTPVKTQAATGINQTINYQARLLNAQGAVVPDGNYNVQFKIYKNGDGTATGDTSGSPAGTLLWTESWQNSSTQGVTVKNGYFAVQLGAICSLGGGTCQGNTNTGVDFNQSVLWLSVNIGGTAAGTATYDGEMLPMRQLASSPYAFNSNLLGGLSAAQFLQLAPNTVQTDSSTNNSIFVNKTGASGNVLDLQSAGTNDLIINNAGNVVFQQTALSQAAFEINNSLGNNVFAVDTTDSQIGINLGGHTTPSLTTSGLEIAGALKVDTTAEDTFITPIAGASTGTKINIPVFAVGNTSQILALGITAASSSTGRVLTVFDPRSGAHQPSITLISPDESQNFGLSFDGSNTTGLLKNSASTIGIQPNGLNVLTVTNASGTGEVGINQTSPSSILDVAANNTQTTGSMALLEQSGTGDASLQFSTPSQSFIVGVDQSQNRFSIGSSVAGYASTGTSSDSSDNLQISCMQAAAQHTGSLGSVSAFVGAIDATNHTFQAALYSGSSAPTTLLASSATTNLTASSWNTATLSPVSVTAGQVVWICYETATTSTVLNNLQIDPFALGVSFTKANSNFSWPSTMGAGSSGITTYSMYASYTNSSFDAFTPTGSSLFNLNGNGDVTFQNTVNNTQAFNIQSAVGVSLLNVDTTNNEVNIGGGFGAQSATPALLVVGSKNTSGDPAGGVDGAMYYNQITSTFRCFSSGAWLPCTNGSLYTQTAVPGTDGVSNTNVNTAFAESYTVPANDCVSGRQYRISAAGNYTTTTTAPTMGLTLVWAGTVIVTFPTITLPASMTTVGAGWNLSATVQCYAGNPSASGSIATAGSVSFASNAAGTTLSSGVALFSNGSATSSITFNTATGGAVQLKAKWNNASTANFIALRQFTVEGLGPD